MLRLVCDTLLRVARTAVLHPGPGVTPALRALSARGTTFVQAVSPSSWTLPAMAAVFSGLDATGNRHAARAEAAALAERFAAAGYETLAVSANPLLTADNGFARGFRNHVAAPAASVADLRADPGELRAWDAGALVARALREVDSPAGPGPLGAAYGDHGEQLLEEALRVPLILAGAGVPQGRRELRAVTTRDLGATLLQLAGLPAPGATLPLADDESAPGILFGAGTRGRSARRGNRVLIRPYPGRAGVPARLLAVEPERLVLRGDDHAGDEPARMEVLRSDLQAWLEEAGEEAPPLDPETRARLEALGYLR